MTEIVFDKTPLLGEWVAAFLRSRKAEGLTPGSIQAYSEKFKQFMKWCEGEGVNTVSDVTADVLRKFMLYLEDTNHNAGGRLAYYVNVRALVRWWAIEEEPENWRNPFARVKPPKVALEPLEPVEVDTIRAMLDATYLHYAERNRAILMTLYDTGLRARELCNLELRDYNPHTGELMVFKGKGQKFRTVFVGQATRRSIRHWLRKRGAHPGALFITERGGKFTYKGLRAVIHLAARLVGVKAPTLHAFRRAFALNCLRAGMDLLTLQKLMGHADLSVLHRYVKHTKDDLAEAYRRASPADKL